MAAQDGGKAPGSQRFQSQTGIAKHNWYPQLWLRWGDAIREAACQQNVFITSFDSEFLIKKYIELIRELQSFPIEGQLKVKRKLDRSFPNPSAFSRLGSKWHRASEVLQYCQTHEGFSDVIPICMDVIASKPMDRQDQFATGFAPGYVYLVRHGARQEFKIGRTYNTVRREGEIAIELPEMLKPVHNIKTDDPAGVESYWHKRFEAKRKNGEWFALNAEDVRAFKRWKRIY